MISFVQGTLHVRKLPLLMQLFQFSLREFAWGTEKFGDLLRVTQPGCQRWCLNPSLLDYEANSLLCHIIDSVNIIIFIVEMRKLRSRGLIDLPKDACVLDIRV